MNFGILVVAGLLGVIAHWYNRYAQGRTQDSFLDYLKYYKANTISSLLSNFAATTANFAASPVDLSMQVVLLAFTSGYTLDSVLNKGTNTGQEIENTTVVTETKSEAIAKEIKQADKNKSLSDILNDDSKL